jgi:hypothetical protein
VASGFNIEIKGLKETLTKLNKEEVKVETALDFAIGIGVDQMATEAKNKVVVDTGRLRASISSNKLKKFFYELVAQVDYAAYVEFGTGKYYLNHGGQWDVLASKFKGKGKREVNLQARPYIYPSVNHVLPIIEKDLQDIADKKIDI